VGLVVAVLLVRAMSNDRFSTSGGLLGLLVVVLWLVFWWRVGRTGVFVDSSRVSSRGVFWSRTVPLRSVARVNGMSNRGVRQLVIHTSGRPIFTPVRGAVTESADTDARPGVLPAAEFDRVLGVLQGRAKAAPSPKPKAPKQRPARPPASKPEQPDDPPDYPPGTLFRRTE
jgi:hypothetical protein